MKEMIFEDGSLILLTFHRVIANFLMWRLALTTSGLLSDQIRARRLEYTSVLTGVKKYRPRWKECVSATSSSLSKATSALYVDKYFNEKSKQDALELVEMIKEEFRGNLKTIDWMDEKTRKAALEKALKMTNFIGYPDELKDQKLLTKYYNGLKINRNEYLKSYLRINLFATKKDMVKFREPVNKTSWEDHSDVALVNAFYSPSENSIRKLLLLFRLWNSQCRGTF